MVEIPKTADDWLERVHQEFERESDRGAVIVVAAMLDDALARLIGKRLVPADTKRSLLHQHNAPLGTFSARIDAAFQLGLISHWMARDLHQIRKIRNTFAHDSFGCTFEAEAVKTRVAVLERASDYNKKYPDTRKNIGPTGARWDFLGIAAWILYDLNRSIEEPREALKEPGAEFGYVDWESLPAGFWESLPVDVMKRLKSEENQSGQLKARSSPENP